MVKPGSHTLVLSYGASDTSDPADAVVIGFVSGYLVADEVQLLNLALLPAHRGSGNGAALLSDWLQHCR